MEDYKHVKYKSAYRPNDLYWDLELNTRRI